MTTTATNVAPIRRFRFIVVFVLPALPCYATWFEQTLFEEDLGRSVPWLFRRQYHAPYTRILLTPAPVRVVPKLVGIQDGSPAEYQNRACACRGGRLRLRVKC